MHSKFLPPLSRSLSIAAVCALLGGAAFAQAPTSPATPATAGTPATGAAPAEKPKSLNSAEDAYVKNAVRGLSYLIQMAKTLPASTDQAQAGQSRLRDTTVKDLTGAQTALNKIIEEHALKVSADLVGNDKTDVERITKGFTKTPIKGFENKPTLDWVGEILKESKRLDHETEMIGKQGQDADLKMFATNYGPSIRNVFTSAEALDKTLKTKKK